MSSYYQTSAKPRGRREMGMSETPTRSRAPSEALNLTKKISRTSDESTLARGTNIRPSSPAVFMQRNRALDRSSLLETILPPSSSSSPKLNKATAGFEPEVPLSNHATKSHTSTPTSPILTTSSLESRAENQQLHSKASSKSMTDAADLVTRHHTVPPTRKLSIEPDTGKMASSLVRDGSATTQHPAARAYLQQPGVADPSEETTPKEMPAIEHANVPFAVAKVFEADQQVPPPTNEASPKQHASLPLQPPEQPPQMWYPDPSSQTWQTASPPQSPVIHQYGGFQTPGQAQYPYDYSYTYTPHMAPGGYQQYANQYYSVPYPPPAGTPPFPAVERHISRSSSGQEQNELMNRIQSVLPDLARLLQQSREDQAPPAAVEDTIMRTQLEQNEQILGLQQELDATKKEYERVIRNLVDENCTLKSQAEDRQRRSRSLEGDSRGTKKLRTEFEALQAQHQDLASSVDSIRRSKEELIAEKLSVDKHIESLKKDKHIIKDSHHRALSELKLQHLQELASKDREHQRVAAEHKSVLSKFQLDLATLIGKHTGIKKDLEIVRNSEAAYKASAEARSKELDGAKLHHLQQSDQLRAEHQRSLESLKQEQKGQRQRHETEMKKLSAEVEVFRRSEIEWNSKSQSLQLELQEHKVALAEERETHASLKNVHEERNRKTADLARSMTLWRQKHADLQKETENLDRIFHALGFGSNGRETTDAPQQPERDSEPLPKPCDQPNVPAVSLHDTGESTEGAQKSGIDPTMLEVVHEQEVPTVDNTEPTLEPAKATESLKEGNTDVYLEEAATVPRAAELAFLAEGQQMPPEAVSMRATKKAVEGSAKAAHAEAPNTSWNSRHRYHMHNSSVQSE